jgi:hypothetical protein
MIEHFFQCPYCFEEISMLIDPSEPNQEYIEDCEVCCNPITIKIALDEAEISFFSAENMP